MQLTAVHVRPWTVLDLGELQLKLQLEPGAGRLKLGHVRRGGNLIHHLDGRGRDPLGHP